MDSQALARGRCHQPCAACRTLRRRCDDNCVLAPYFPSEEIQKFAGVHKVFGASNVIKMIQMVEEAKREDAVKAIIYEARARLRDPVYGSTRAIFHLQKMVQELTMQVETVRSQVMELQQQRDQLLALLAKVDLPDPVNCLTLGGDGNFSLAGVGVDNFIDYDPVEFSVECAWIL